MNVCSRREQRQTHFFVLTITSRNQRCITNKLKSNDRFWVKRLYYNQDESKMLMKFNDLFGFNIKIDIGFLSMQKNNLKNLRE